jgi:hypothetical protein
MCKYHNPVLPQITHQMWQLYNKSSTLFTIFEVYRVMNTNGKWYMVSIDLFSDPDFDSFECVCPHQPQSKGFFELRNLKSIFHPFGKPSWAQPSASITTTIHGFFLIDESSKKNPIWTSIKKIILSIWTSWFGPIYHEWVVFFISKMLDCLTNGYWIIGLVKKIIDSYQK